METPNLFNTRERKKNNINYRKYKKTNKEKYYISMKYIIREGIRIFTLVYYI